MAMQLCQQKSFTDGIAQRSPGMLQGLLWPGHYNKMLGTGKVALAGQLGTGSCFGLGITNNNKELELACPGRPGQLPVQSCPGQGKLQLLVLLFAMIVAVPMPRQLPIHLLSPGQSKVLLTYSPKPAVMPGATASPKLPGPRQAPAVATIC